MKKLLICFALFAWFLGSGQITNIADGESLTYRIHYGILNAGTANLTTQKTMYRGIPHLYVKGTGQTTGAVKAFFKVEDLYESFINTSTELPSFYVRNVREGGYTQHFETAFNHDNQTLILTDKKNPANGSRVIKSVKGVQDMLSCFYYLRSKTPAQLKVGTVINMNVWIDDEMFPFQLKVTGTENLKTKFGTINCLKIIPSVKSGRVFKEEEGVTMWVSNDANHVPMLLKAELAVGSLKASIDDYKNVKYPLRFSN
ncbi:MULTISPECIES: DUF3108 domain-containing protein [Chryseobacterium]|uniref:DUF3108 domain-containing protein n=1 Tax=Chryseobacterium camelliae TaxID=1265445 RepID=A0ABU0TJR5_9FLAO|nr:MULTISPECIES: DUF3108 domain-containing protein [Chryseobacterium]MDT3408853.1 hypothetical protein [Pseudacidovorax intermedius]MDQ1097289.1 hypothetical protein [Chryseobacterium camelliae]MDQ1101222.1 hypothetical protein [Chryseobacterium sp. SORGH_AS_1048]MDR6084668.1 hypothetical protein [Chryseobacterium sp. SORGH_AS_0909]MDR6132940.1 hypothetical protein [Chryseobacterium sp. SORGH_AS_1175]